MFRKIDLRGRWTERKAYPEGELRAIMIGMEMSGLLDHEKELLAGAPVILRVGLSLGFCYIARRMGAGRAMKD